MFFTPAFTALALLVAPIFAAPAGLAVQKAAGPKVDDQYIIKLNSGVEKSKTIQWLKQHLDSNSTLTFDYDANFINGFAAKLSPQVLNILAKNPDIASIHEDQIFSINTVVSSGSAPWGLQRITQAAALPSGSSPNTLSYTYKHDNSYDGTGVIVYILDTGCNTAHVNFGGRATTGYSAFSTSADGHGHGTHVSGTAIGGLYGISRSAKVIAVKILDDSGSGSTSGIAAGINWVINQYNSNKIPSIISMSLGGGADTTLDNAVNSAINAGIFVSVAAGNSNTDASTTSPARVAAAFTVGSSNIADARSSFSNYGSVVDIFAPGEYVISSWIGSTTATNNISGTSMATPHVAGVAAYLLSQYGAQTPAALASRIKGLGVSGKLTGIPSGTTNLLLQL